VVAATVLRQAMQGQPLKRSHSNRDLRRDLNLKSSVRRLRTPRKVKQKGAGAGAAGDGADEDHRRTAVSLHLQPINRPEIVYAADKRVLRSQMRPVS
jgi:hypothetical protein